MKKFIVLFLCIGLISNAYSASPELQLSQDQKNFNLIRAAQEGTFEEMNALLAAGADVNAQYWEKSANFLLEDVVHNPLGKAIFWWNKNPSEQWKKILRLLQEPDLDTNIAYIIGNRPQNLLTYILGVQLSANSQRKGKVEILTQVLLHPNTRIPANFKDDPLLHQSFYRSFNVEDYQYLEQDKQQALQVFAQAEQEAERIKELRKDN
jgi:hypothetical protein